jgi:hypothetical protein
MSNNNNEALEAFGTIFTFLCIIGIIWFIIFPVFGKFFEYLDNTVKDDRNTKVENCIKFYGEEFRAINNYQDCINSKGDIKQAPTLIK